MQADNIGHKSLQLRNTILDPFFISKIQEHAVDGIDLLLQFTTLPHRGEKEKKNEKEIENKDWGPNAKWPASAPTFSQQDPFQGGLWLWQQQP